MTTNFYLRSFLLSIFVIIFSLNVKSFDRSYLGNGGLNFYQIEKAEQKLEASRRELVNLKRQLIRLESMARQLNQTAEMQNQRQQILAEVNVVDVDDLKDKIAQKEKFEEVFSDRLNKMASGKQSITSVQMFSRGLMGNDFGYFDDEGITSFQDALKNGFLYAVSKEVGEFLRTKMRGVLQDKLGVLFDGLVNCISDSCSRVQEVMFHDGHKPFEEDKLLAWQSFVNVIFNDVENGVKENLRSAGSGQDMTMRHVDCEDGAMLPVEGSVQEVKPYEQVWANLFSGHVVQFAFLSKILEDCKGYYDEESTEVFLASQLQQRIKEFSLLLLCVNNSSDMDNYLAPNKPAISRIRSNVDQLFKMLQIYTKRRTFTTGSPQAGISIYDRDQKGPRFKDRDNDFEPQSAYAR
jgi:hypothetical protein